MGSMGSTGSPHASASPNRSLREENARLRQEIMSAKQNFVEKIRGGGKRMFSGGGFRASGGSRPNTAGASTGMRRGRGAARGSTGAGGGDRECGTCAHFRTTLQDSRASLDTMGKANDSQRAELEFLGRARLDAETELLTTTQENVTLQSDVQDGLLLLQRAQSKALTLERRVLDQELKLARQEEQMGALRAMLAQARKNTPKNPPPPVPPAAETRPAKEVEALEAALRTARAEAERREKELALLSERVGGLERNNTELVHTHSTEVSVLRTEAADDVAKWGEEREGHACALAVVEEGRIGAEGRETAAAQERDEMGGRVGGLEREIIVLKERVEAASVGHGDAQRELQAKLEQALRDLAAAQARLEEALAALAKEGARGDSAEELSGRMREERDRERAAATESAGALARLSKRMKELQDTMAGARGAEEEEQRRRAEVEEDLESHKSALTSSTSEAQDAKGMVATLKAKVHQLMLDLEEEKVGHATTKGDVERVRKQVQQEALETTLQSMVRLCVVAPTVNVRMNANPKAARNKARERERKTAGGGDGEGGESMETCTPPFPHGKVRGIIEDDILPLFTQIFIQSEEGLAPDGSKLETWLEDMLAEMQGSIEEHLSDVFRKD